LLCDNIRENPDPFARFESKFPRITPLIIARKTINTSNKFFLFIKQQFVNKI